VLLGQPKSLNELSPLTVATIKGLAQGMEQQLTSGAPKDVPMMMPMGQLMQIARTMAAYLDITVQLIAAIEEAREAELLAPEARVFDVVEEAQALPDIPEPPPPPRIQPASGHLIIPK